MKNLEKLQNQLGFSCKMCDLIVLGLELEFGILNIPSWAKTAGFLLRN